jgi:hypothetical protein
MHDQMKAARFHHHQLKWMYGSTPIRLPQCTYYQGNFKSRIGLRRAALINQKAAQIHPTAES